jgi:hypothetical protein
MNLTEEEIAMFNVGDTIEGEYETLKILFVGKTGYYCEILDLDIVSYPDHYEEVGDEKHMGAFFIHKRYGILQ